MIPIVKKMNISDIENITLLFMEYDCYSFVTVCVYSCVCSSDEKLFKDSSKEERRRQKNIQFSIKCDQLRHSV